MPVSDTEADNRVEREVGGTPAPELPAGTEPLHHHELLWMIGGYEPDRGVAAAGHRAYFLTGAGTQLNIALISYALEFLRKREYSGVQPPYFLNKEAMGAVAELDDYDEQLYHVSGEKGDSEKYLIATSEQPLCTFHRGDWLNPKDLPVKYAGWSTCFRKEAGSHGRDTWGIFRVHQFEKIEQFVVCAPEDSWRIHEEMIATAEDFYKSLGIAYRVITLVSKEVSMLSHGCAAPLCRSLALHRAFLAPAGNGLTGRRTATRQPPAPRSARLISLVCVESPRLRPAAEQRGRQEVRPRGLVPRLQRVPRARVLLQLHRLPGPRHGDPVRRQDQG